MRRQPIPPEVPGFETVRLLGQGGFADVFLCQQASPRRRVAIKVLVPALPGKDAAKWLAAEADAMAELSTHPNVVTVYQTGVSSDQRPYLVMEYCPGPSLGATLRQSRFAVPQVLEIGVQIAGAVETAHRLGMVHRDIKPANILVTEYGTPALTDFGIATSAGTESLDAVSVPWAPPECFWSPPKDGLGRDIWGLGATLFALLAGHAPFSAPGLDTSPDAVAHRINQEPLGTIGRADIPESLRLALERALAKRPSDRYATALDLARSLQGVQRELLLPVTQVVVGRGNPMAGEPPVVDDDATRFSPRELTSPSGPPSLTPVPVAAPPQAGPATAPFADPPQAVPPEPFPSQGVPPTLVGPPVPPPRRRSRTKAILAASIAVVLLAGGGVGGWLILSHRGQDQPAAAGPSSTTKAPSKAAEPTDQPSLTPSSTTPPPPSFAPDLVAYCDTVDTIPGRLGAITITSQPEIDAYLAVLRDGEVHAPADLKELWAKVTGTYVDIEHLLLANISGQPMSDADRELLSQGQAQMDQAITEINGRNNAMCGDYWSEPSRPPTQGTA